MARAVLAAVAVAFGLALVGAAADPGEGADGNLVGAERCGVCHRKAYEAWKESRHAAALDRLGQTVRPECLACHATGRSRRMGNVQCEACHGPGRLYAQRHVMLDREARVELGLVSRPAPESCLRCHTADAPSPVPFDYPAAWQRIRH